MSIFAREWGAWIAMLVGVVGGSVVDPAPERPRVERGAYRVLSADLHVHTRFSDGTLSPFEAVLAARRHGLDVLAITEHNVVFPAQMARWFSRLVGGPTVLVGTEVTTQRYHLIGLGLSSSVPPYGEVDRTLREIHRQGGVAIAAHPVRQYWRTYAPVAERLDGCEVVHSIAFAGPRRRGWRWEEMVEFYERHGGGTAMAAIGSSDYHFFKLMGLGRTLVFADGDGDESILDAIREGRTVVEGPDGRLFGDAEARALIAAEPLPPPVGEPVGYDASGWGDAVTRAIGWLGLLGWMLLGGRRVGAA